MTAETGSDDLVAVLDVFRAADPREPLATSEVAEHFECTRRTTYNRLDRLAERGTLRTKKVGAKGRVWWLASETEAGDDADGAGGVEEVGPRYRRLVDAAPVPIGVFTLGEGIVYANEAAAAFVGASDPEVVVGHPAFEFVASPDREATREDVRSVLEGGTAPDPATRRFRTVDGEERVGIVALTPVTHGDDDAVQFVIRDVTERRERERELEATNERLNAVIESSPAAIMSIDLDDRVQQWNPAAERIFGWSEAEVLGEPLPIVPADRDDEFERINDRVTTGGSLTDVEVKRRTKDGSPIDVSLSAGPLRDADGEVVGVTAALADISDRKESERRLQHEKERFERLVSNLPGMVYRCRNERGWPMEFVEGECEQLTGYDAAALETGEVVWGEDVLHPEDRDRTWDRVQATVAAGEPFEVTYRIHDADGETKWMWERGRGIHDDGELVALEGFIADVTHQKRQQRRLERQREQLATLNDLNEVVQRTTHAIVAADSRADVERSVCERLAGSERYSGAWIGDWRGADAASFRVRASEGCADGGKPVESTADEALRTGEPCRRRGVDDFGRVPPDDVAEKPQSVASIPITHAGVTYGVLTLCSSRPDAFDDRELSTVARLGEVVGHGIAAAERKAALMGERATELEFRSAESVVPFPADEAADVSLDRTIPLADGTIVYCTVGGVEPEAFVDAVGEIEAVESVTPIAGVTGDPRFEVRMAGETVASVIAAAGGRIRSTDAVDGGVRIVAEVAPGTDVRRVVEAVRAAYPDLELASRGTVEREDGVDPTPGAAGEELTDRQRRVLETAFQAGYFDRPRGSTGEEVAESLGVSASTFHEHLRVGERKLFSALFGSN
jgi:PAS domain S-box-containing protein